ncbi:YdiY family protein [Phenylobacterium sp. J367]|uniref:DUF481 domain-containing protein n=1 Tax=Phenylobacterium sp. J367 TaxID=2898435 RepID=UPI002151F903|nr:DUF481 domain-containing protein [Phenylobacterium sp. J367]MCR5880826.1 DUF481 domain-containing protein [Phenylobacterium sp. J367]
MADILDAAAEDPESLAAVVKAAKRANPEAAAEIDAHVAAASARAAAAKAQQAADAGFLEGWNGKGEIGGSISTGNTDDYGLVVSLAFDKKTPVWEHDANLSTSFKSEDEKTTTDRYFATYAIRRNFGPRFYGVGILWGERDRFAGHNFRFSEGVGLGYRVIRRPDLKLSLEAGPALRQSDYLVTGYEGTAAVRLAGYLTWQIRPRLEFTQSFVTYRDTTNSTVLAATALTTRLQGALSARASYEYRNEQDPPQGRENTDTTTRATLLFNF